MNNGGIGSLVTNSKSFIQQMRIHLPLFALSLLRTGEKPPKASVNCFVVN